jgi:hypothetical protein
LSSGPVLRDVALVLRGGVSPSRSRNLFG